MLQPTIYRHKETGLLATTLPIMEMGQYEEATDIEIMIENKPRGFVLSDIIGEQLVQQRYIDWDRDDAINDFARKFLSIETTA